MNTNRTRVSSACSAFTRGAVTLALVLTAGGCDGSPDAGASSDEGVHGECDTPEPELEPVYDPDDYPECSFAGWSGRHVGFAVNVSEAPDFEGGFDVDYEGDCVLGEYLPATSETRAELHITCGDLVAPWTMTVQYDDDAALPAEAEGASVHVRYAETFNAHAALDYQLELRDEDGALLLGGIKRYSSDFGDDWFAPLELRTSSGVCPALGDCGTTEQLAVDLGVGDDTARVMAGEAVTVSLPEPIDIIIGTAERKTDDGLCSHDNEGTYLHVFMIRA